MNWNRIRAIAWWEYLQRVRSKGFLISLVLTPALIVAFGVLPSLLATQEPDRAQKIGVADETGRLFAPLSASVAAIHLSNGKPAYELVDVLGGRRDPAAAIADADSIVLAGEHEGTLVLRDSAGRVMVDYRSENTGTIMALTKFERIIQRVVVERRLAEVGIDTAVYNRVNEEVDISTIKISKNGASGTGFIETFFTAYAGCILLMLLIITTGQSLVRSLLEEKSNRIMELLVGSSTPYELMWGKLLGLSGLGITQMSLWVVLGLGSVTLIQMPSGFGATLQGVYAVLPIIFTYMVLGYIFYAALFIAFGSLVTTEQEAQLVNSYLVMLLVLPMAFSMVVIQTPDAGYIRTLSHIPFLTPSLMMIRIVAKTPPAWEIASTIGTMILSTAILVRIAGRVFRTAILLYGKRPSMREVFRWLRTS